MTTQAAPPLAMTRAGHVALLGPSNAGKSSLLNRFLGRRLSAVSGKPQTTRERVLGVDTQGQVQIVFVDTPGLVEPAYLLHHAMLEQVGRAASGADLLALVIDAAAPLPALAPEWLSRLLALEERVIPVLNKIDATPPGRLERARRWVTDSFGKEPFELSALTGQGVDVLRRELGRRLPFSPFLYPADDIAERPVRYFAGELVREAVFDLYAEEIPYSVAVRVDEFRERGDHVYIRATIFVERSSQKGILLGRKGTKLRELGSEARRRVEEFTGSRVFLDLWVKVLPKWRKDPGALRRLGFDLPNPDR
ncbi:MAG: GTPase Era [Longimicrobiaceae bacterium]